MTSSLQLKKKAIAEASISIFNGSLSLSQVTSYKRDITDVVKTVKQMNIVSDVTPNFASERAILKLVGGSITIDLSSMKRNYTENEMKHGI
jgi:hypothetical protein